MSLLSLIVRMIPAPANIASVCDEPLSFKFLGSGSMVLREKDPVRGRLGFLNFLCNTMTAYKELLNLITSLEGDFEKFYSKDNGAAGTRLRKGMQTLKTMAHELRKEIQERKNNFTSTKTVKSPAKK